jgi:hypothetical protein
MAYVNRNALGEVETWALFPCPMAPEQLPDNDGRVVAFLAKQRRRYITTPTPPDRLTTDSGENILDESGGVLVAQ